MKEHKLPVVAIVGRPNVGKSALFNKIMKSRISIVHEQCGVTRDRIAAPTSYFGKHFLLVDTGGLGVLVDEKKVEVFDGLIRDQVEAIVKEADSIIFVVDSLDGVTPQDKEVANLLRQAGCTVTIAANKSDNSSLVAGAEGEFSCLGFKEILPTSCTQNSGVGYLLDSALREIEPVPEPEKEEKGLKIAVVGRPNVGKSSLVNALLGEERVIVSDIAGTTRDAVDVPFQIDDGEEKIPCTLIDTAGLRRRRQVDTVVEFFSVTRSERAIGRADMVIFMIDATSPGTAQDKKIAGIIQKEGKPCFILVNKWDLLKGKMPKKDLLNLCRTLVPFMKFCPMDIISAKEGLKIDSVIRNILNIRDQLDIQVPTSVLNRFLQDILARTPPPAAGPKRLKLMYATSKNMAPPHFVLFVNDKKLCPPNYLQFIEKKLHQAFFPGGGLPISLELRSRTGAGGTKAHGKREMVKGLARQKKAKSNANARHHERRKGWRKKK